MIRSVSTLIMNKIPFPYLKEDTFLDPCFAKELQEEILNIPSEEWDRYDNPLNKNIRYEINLDFILFESFVS